MPLELTDDLRARFTQALENIPFTRLVGLVVTGLAPDEVRMRLPYREDVGRGHGIPHGGAVFTLLDVTAGAMCAIANSAIGAGTTYVTLQATTQFLGVAHHEDLECVARPVKIGKSITFVDAEISAGGNPVARGSFVFKTTRSGGAPAGGTSEQR
jgi:uncharacterized protein (TIGR00369 family)